MKQPFSAVHRVDFFRVSAQHQIGESTGGGADVDCFQPGQVGEMFHQRRFELSRSPAGEGIGSVHEERRVERYQFRGLGNDRIRIAADFAGHNQALSLVPVGADAVIAEVVVNAQFFHGSSCQIADTTPFSVM